MPLPDPDPQPFLRLVTPGAGAGLAERMEREPLGLAYRPIAELDDDGHGERTVAGYEALVGLSPTADGPWDTPAGWSRQGHAARSGCVEARLVRAALSSRSSLPDGAFLLVKVSSRALPSDELAAVFAEDEGDLRRVVVAVSDDAYPADTPAVGRAIERLRAAGASYAVDDTGAGSASLEQLVGLRPDFVRIGETFVTEVDRDPARAAVVEALVGVASRIGARVIAADVGGVPELHALMRLGVGLAQGPALGAPSPEMAGLAPEVHAAVASGRVTRRDERTVSEALEPLEPLEAGMSAGDVADRFLADPRHDAMVAIDLEGRPVALLDRPALLRGEPYESTPMTVGPDAPLTEVARRATARPAHDRLRPLVVCDAHGRYLGIVRIERLLDALAARGGAGGDRERRG